MKHFNKTISIKWKIFGSLLIFIILIIAILWLFQVFFLENFYMYIKENTVKQAAIAINEVIDDENYQDQINAISKNNDFCVLVYHDEEDSPIFSSNSANAKCGIREFSIRNNMSIVQELREEAKKNGGSASQLLDKEVDIIKDVPRELPEDMINTFPSDDEFSKDKPRFAKDKMIQSMTYISVVTGMDNVMKTIVVNAQLTPVTATVETIQTQFWIIAAILIVVALLLALYLSKRIGYPIIRINESAKQLATGDYNVTFNAYGYLEVKELNDTLNYAAKELAKVENLRRELIANMSHDLRTPLTMIAGYGEVMRDIPGENTAENVQIIIDETKRLTNLVNDMLDLSKLQAGVQALELETINITQEIQDIIMRYDKMLIKNIHLDFISQQDIFVEADLVKIDQVLYNLMNNAINYCGEDQTVVIRQTRIEDKVKIEIIDHGPGIEKDQLPYIWERYYKVDKTHVRSKVGSGLGLSIVRTVLDMHKADYGVESEIGKGTTFWFSLPINSI